MPIKAVFDTFIPEFSTTGGVRGGPRINAIRRQALHPSVLFVRSKRYPEPALPQAGLDCREICLDRFDFRARLIQEFDDLFDIEVAHAELGEGGQGLYWR